MGRSETTRNRLQTVALELILEQGYDATTVDQIAAAAGVSHMTFFRHFPTKESVVLSDPYDPVIAEAVAAQPAGLSPVERVRCGLLVVADAMGDHEDAETRIRIGIAARHPRLRAGMWENNQRTAAAITGALVDTGVDPFEASVAAGACLGALMAALIDWATTATGESLGRRIERALAQLAAPGHHRSGTAR